MQLWRAGSGDRWQCSVVRHAMLPGSQESRELCLPGGHPTWDEGTGAKEEKVSAGWGPGQEAGHGAIGMGWRSRPAIQAPLGSQSSMQKETRL